MPIDPTLTAADALHAIEAFLGAMREAQEMAERGVVGREMDEVLRHAKDLLDIFDQVLLVLDPKKSPAVFQVAPVLRVKLEVFVRRAARRQSAMTYTR